MPAGKFVTYGDGELFAAQGALQVVDLDLEIVDQLGDEEILGLVRRPVGGVQVLVVFQRLEDFEREFRAFGDDGFAQVVGDALRGSCR